MLETKGKMFYCYMIAAYSNFTNHDRRVIDLVIENLTLVLSLTRI